MNCHKCSTEGELKVFQSFQYYWCGQCKDEIKEAPSAKEIYGTITLPKGFQFDVGSLPPGTIKYTQPQKSPWTTYCDECQVDTAIIDHYPTCTQHPKWQDPAQLSFNFPPVTKTWNGCNIIVDPNAGDKVFFINAETMRALGRDIAKNGVKHGRK